MISAVFWNLDPFGSCLSIPRQESRPSNGFGAARQTKVSHRTVHSISTESPHFAQQKEGPFGDLMCTLVDSSPGRFRQASGLFVDSLEKFIRLHTESGRDGFEHAQANLFASQFEVGHVVLVHPSLFGKVNLFPAPRMAQRADASTERNADVPCHPYYRRDTLGFASTLSYGQMSER
jgi:hypothetical protein